MQSHPACKKPSIWDPQPPAPVIDKSAFIGKKPSKVISVPHEYQRVTLARERDLLVHDIKENTNCVVIPQWDRQGKVTSFDLHGSGFAVDKAVRRLHEWISNAQKKSVGASAWAKMPAWIYNDWYYQTVETMELERKQKYKGGIVPNDDGELPDCKAIVVWPEDLSNREPEITPRDAFGNKLEALDALRMQVEVYIHLLPVQNRVWQIEIIGDDPVNVYDAEDRLGTMIERVRADASGVQLTHNIILDQSEGLDIELVQDESWWPNHVDPVVPHLLPSYIMDEPGTYRHQGLHTLQVEGVQYHLKSALEHIRSRKGAYDFVVRLGSVALSSKHVKVERIGYTFKKEHFVKEIDGPIELDVKKWLANDDVGYRILHRLMASEDYLEPTKSAAYFGYIPETLKKTRPTFRGTWVFRDPNTGVSQSPAPIRHAGRPAPLNQKPVNNEKAAPSPISLFVVQVDWTDDEEGSYEKGAPRFYKLGPGKQGPTKNMDINLLELGESRGWHFALESLIPLPTKIVPPILTGFADRVRMKAKYDPCSSTESFAEWDQTPTIKKHLVTGRLESVYSFGIKETCYKVEATAMWYPQHKRPVWGLAVRHTEWAAHLADLENLAVGRRADWGDTISTFFPADGHSSSYKPHEEDLGMGVLRLCKTAGVDTLINHLLRLSDIVSSVTAGGGIQLASVVTEENTDDDLYGWDEDS
ncbi:hypothetical protein FB567DRAFT_29175 [Paraphoma chrysanthemicola]|uniref:DUF7905 domain-containing protein n=1 Tax=Paraphoma chrysanthemicola TaxID=798071 RepID=A0A8K0W4Z9_9PLEO|nr:hypothetical protein FB567DRAFT_29175 [Paraphoma chrysanthemicola]